MKPSFSTDIEIYAFTDDMDAVVRAISLEVGPWNTVSAPFDGLTRHEVGSVLLLLQRSKDESWSVWLRGSDRWPSSAALARFLVRELDCEVRCEAEQHRGIASLSNVFLRITPASEELIAWE